MLKRGIVISPPFQPLFTGGIRCGGDPDPVELRKYLLYWDQIDYPSNNLVHVSSADIDFLETTDALKRTRVAFQGRIQSGNGEFFVAAQEAALRENQKLEPGAWTLAQLSGVPFYSNGFEGLGVEFELYGMLPVPVGDTPLVDILEFKERRRAEIEAFRIHMDDIYQRIISSADIARAKTTEIGRLENAIKDLDASLRESGIKRFAGNIRNTINMDFSGIIGAGLGAAGLSSTIGLSPLVAGLAGAGIVMGYRTSTMPQSETCPSGLSYLSSVRRNFHY
jgi:hypothetical protein